MIFKLANLQAGMTKKIMIRICEFITCSHNPTRASDGPGPGSKQLAPDPDLQPGQSKDLGAQADRMAKLRAWKMIIDPEASGI